MFHKSYREFLRNSFRGNFKNPSCDLSKKNESRAMVNSNDQTPLAFTAARIFLGLNGVIWLVFAGITAFGAHPSYEDNLVLRWSFAIIAALIGGGLIALMILLARRNQTIYALTLIALSGIALANIFDQMGPIDFAVLAAAVIPLVLLLLSRRWYFAR